MRDRLRRILYALKDVEDEPIVEEKMLDYSLDKIPKVEDRKTELDKLAFDSWNSERDKMDSINLTVDT